MIDTNTNKQQIKINNYMHMHSKVESTLCIRSFSVLKDSYLTSYVCVCTQLHIHGFINNILSAACQIVYFIISIVLLTVKLCAANSIQ